MNDGTLLPRRRYVRPTAEQWAEIRALWASGGIDLASLSERFGVTGRAIQSHCRKHGIVRGAASAARAKAVEERVLAEVMPEGDDDLATKIRFAKATALQDADTIRSLVLAQFGALREPAEGLSIASALRAIDIGAAALERARRSRFTALGLDKGDPLATVELPELPIRVLSDEEVAAIREAQLREDPQWPADDDDDDRVIEGEDDA